MTFFVVPGVFFLLPGSFSQSVRLVVIMVTDSLCALLQFVFVVSPTRDFNTRIYDWDYILILILSQQDENI